MLPRERCSSGKLEHSEQLEDAEVSDTHFFGINGRGKLSDLFDFVFVSADLRAAEEATERKDSLLDRILRRAVDRTGFDEGIEEITANFAARYVELSEAHLATQLDEVAAQITAEVESYSPGRAIRLSQAAGTMKPPPSVVAVHVADRGAETPVTHQGHGFQRTLLLAGLTVLSRQSRVGEQSTSMFLAIEEPEALPASDPGTRFCFRAPESRRGYDSENADCLRHP